MMIKDLIEIINEINEMNEMNEHTNTTKNKENYMTMEKVMKILHDDEDGAGMILVHEIPNPKSESNCKKSHENTRTCNKKCKHECKITSDIPNISNIPNIERVAYNKNATIVFFDDKTKSVAICDPEDEFNPISGFAIAVCKRIFGKKNFHKMLTEYCHKEYESRKARTKKNPKKG